MPVARRSGAGPPNRVAGRRLDDCALQSSYGVAVQSCGGALISAVRLARNGRNWHHLLELCRLVGALVIDGDGVHDPAVPNDRLLLGLKGTRVRAG